MTEHVYDQLAAHVLGSLSDEEAALVVAHLQICELCRLELNTLSETIHALPLALEPVAPAAELRQRILQSARSESTGPAGGGAETVSPHAGAGAEPIVTHPGSMPSRRSSVLTLPYIAGIALVLFAAGITLGTFVGHTSQSPLQKYNALVAAAITGGNRVEALRPVTGAGGSLHLVLSTEPSGHADLIIGPTTPPPTGKVYELWFIHATAAPHRAGVFTPTSSDARVVPLSTPSSGYEVGAMTVEPGPSGSRRPTTTPFVEAHL